MDNRAIGVFDSGLGGLTAFKELRRELPCESLVYFGDTGRVPYGTRGADTIIRYAMQDVRFLMGFDVKAVVVACGTVSSVALTALKESFSLPIIGVIESSVIAAAEVTKNKKIGVIGTPGTIASGSYEKGLRAIDPEFEIYTMSCPLFVPLVENGRHRKGDIVITTIAREYLAEIVEKGIDTLIMGCTHYPLMEDVLREVCGPGVEMINPGAVTSKAVKELLIKEELTADCSDKNESRFYVSDIVDGFTKLAEDFLGEKMNSEVKKIDIEEY